MVCKKCGKTLESGARYCSRCGTRQSDQSVSEIREINRDTTSISDVKSFSDKKKSDISHTDNNKINSAIQYSGSKLINNKTREADENASSTLSGLNYYIVDINDTPDNAPEMTSADKPDELSDIIKDNRIGYDVANKSGVISDSIKDDKIANNDEDKSGNPFDISDNYSKENNQGIPGRTFGVFSRKDSVSDDIDGFFNTFEFDDEENEKNADSFHPITFLHDEELEEDLPEVNSFNKKDLFGTLPDLAAQANAGASADSSAQANAGASADSAAQANAGSSADSSAQANAGSQSDTEAQPYDIFFTDFSSQSNAGSLSDSAAQTNAGFYTDFAAQKNAGYSVDSAVQTNAGSLADSAAQANAGSLSDSASHSNAGSLADSAAQANAGSLADSVAQTNAGSQADSEAQSNAGSLSDSASHSNAEYSANSASQANAGFYTDFTSQANDGASADLALQANAVPLSDSASDSNAGSKADTTEETGAQKKSKSKDTKKGTGKNKKNIILILLFIFVVILAVVIFALYYSDFMGNNNGQMKINNKLFVSVSDAPGEYGQEVSLKLFSSVSDSAIYYTTDGSDPSLNSETYSQPLQLSGGSYTIKALVYKSNEFSKIRTFEYQINSTIFGVGSAILYEYSGSYNDAAGLPVPYSIKFNIPAITSAGQNIESLKQELQGNLETYYTQYDKLINGDYSIMPSWGLSGWEVSYDLFNYKGMYDISINDTMKFNGNYALETHVNKYYDSVKDSFISAYQYAESCGIDSQIIIDLYNNSEYVQSGELVAVSQLSDIQFYINESGEPVVQFDRTINM